MPCKKGTKKHFPFQETEAKSCESNKIAKRKHACIMEAHESTRQRLESSLPKDHEDHIAGEGYNSMTHYNLVHQFIPVRQAMKIPDAKAALDKEWEKFETIHFNVVYGKINLLHRNVHSANQLCVYGAVTKWCGTNSGEASQSRLDSARKRSPEIQIKQKDLKSLVDIPRLPHASGNRMLQNF